MNCSRSTKPLSGAAKAATPRFPLLALAVAACLASPAWAQTADDTPTDDARQTTQTKDKQHATDLDAVVVVGSRGPESINEIPASVYFVKPEDIENRIRGGVNLKETLGQLVPSLDTGTQSARTNAFQNLQGQDAKVMINGVSMNSVRGIHRQFDSIDPFNVDHVVVMSGASSLYGAGATGGIIDIVTKRGTEGPLGMTAQVGLGTKGKNSIDDRKMAASVQGGSDRVSGRLSFAWHKYGQFYGANGEKIFPDISQTSLQHNVSKDIMGTLNFDMGSAGKLELLGQHYDSHMIGDKSLYLGPNLAGLLGGMPQLLEVRSGYESDLTPGTKRNMFTADWNVPDAVFGQSLLLQGFYRSEDLNFYPFPGFTPAVPIAGTTQQVPSVPYYSGSSQNTRIKGIKTALIADLGQHVKLTYGVDYTHDQFEADAALFDPVKAFGSGGLKFDRMATLDRYPGFTARQIAAYAQINWAVTPDVKLTAGLRHERIHISLDDFVDIFQQILLANGVGQTAETIPGGSDDYSATLPNAGVVWSLSASKQLYANFSQGFTIPDPAKYYGQGDYTYMPANGGSYVLDASTSINSSPLAPVKTSQLQVGFRGSSERVDYNVSAFYTKSDKAVRVVPVVLNVVQFDQPGRTYGLQGKVSYRFTPSWQVGTGGIWVRTKEKVNGNWQNTTVTASSPSKLVSFLTYAPGENLSFTLQSTTVDNLEDGSGQKLRGYTTLDMFGSWRRGKWQINAGIQNLTDRDYQTLWSQRQQIFAGAALAPAVYFPGVGRSFSVSATVDF
jgi:iron complex outermembrane receptor protein